MKGKQFRKSAAPLRDILHGDISKWGTAALSQTVFYVLIAIATLLFALFYMVGYSQPYDENPDINAPLFTGAVIWFMLATTAIAAAGCVGLQACLNFCLKQCGPLFHRDGDPGRQKRDAILLHRVHKLRRPVPWPSWRRKLRRGCRHRRRSYRQTPG